MAYNPLGLRMGPDGVMRDKYGREFSYDPELQEKARKKKRVWVSYHAHKPKKGTA